MKTEPY